MKRNPTPVQSKPAVGNKTASRMTTGLTRSHLQLLQVRSQIN
ncbi:hypothetical protein [Microcoleus vaginatus]